MMNGAFAVSCFLVMWTRIDCGGLTANASSPSSSSFSRDDDSGRMFSPEKLSDGKLPEEKRIIGDSTVRNFFPMKGKQKWMRKEFPPLTEMLVFNVSLIGDDEEVTLAQLHLHRRRQIKTRLNYHKRFLPTPYRVLLYQIQSDRRRKASEDARTMKLASLPVSQATKAGWHTLDVTPVVRELLINAQGPVELLFGVRFEAPKRLDKSLSSFVPAKHFLKNPNVYTPEHPYKTSSYLVVYSETDPFFEEFEDEDFQLIDNLVPPTSSLKERHLKHKMSKGNDADSNANHVEGGEVKETKEKFPGKYDPRMENEVFKLKKKDGIRHKHGGSELKKRSKADEIALEKKTKLKSLPFLHANEVEEIRQTSRRLTRSSTVHREQEEKKSRNGKSELITPVKVQEVAKIR